MLELPALLERCRQGDELAWEAFVRRFEARVYGMALHYSRNAEEARDVAQDVFVLVWRHLAEASDDATFVPWLLRLTRNASIDRLRRRKARRAADEVQLEALPALPSGAASPEETAAAGFDRRLVWRALGRLSDANREILLLKDIQGLEQQEISHLLSIPPGTVKSRLHRARLELARHVLALDPSHGT